MEWYYDSISTINTLNKSKFSQYKWAHQDIQQELNKQSPY